MNKLCFRKWLATAMFTLLVFITTLQAQTGIIKGSLIDSLTNETVLGAIIVSPENPSYGAQSDMDGNFVIQNITPGIYNFKISYVGFKQILLSNIEVKAAEVTDLGAIPLSPDKDIEIEIIGELSTNTESAVVQEIREQDQVVSGISAEQITKSQDRDAAAVISRIPGVTLIDNRFIMVRGLSERYNNVLLNGAIAPSSESETRAFSFDILPSNVLDRILVFKSGSAEMPGDFAGSVIKVYTKAIVDKNIVSLGLSLGYRTQTTFNSFSRQSGYSSDWTTFGNYSRDLPEGFPSDVKNLGFDYNKAVDYSKQLDYNWSTKKQTALPDLRMNLLIGKNFYVKQTIKISSVNNASYSNVYQTYLNERNRFWNYDSEGKSQQRFAFKDQYYNNSYRLGLMSNWSANFTKSPNKKVISFRNFYTRSAFNETMFRSGYDIEKTQEVLFTSLRYGTNAIFSSQLQGEHGMRSDKDNITWIAGFSQITRNEPDWKRASQTRTLGSSDPFRTVVQSGPTAQDGASFFTKLTESVVMNSIDYSRNLLSNADSSRIRVTLKTGYYAEYKARTYYARWMSLTDGGLDPSLKFLSPDQLFQEQYLGYPNGLLLQEGTRTQDRYEASNTLLAGYAGANLVVGKVTVDAGLRLEYNRQQINTAIDGKPLEIDNPIVSPLPFGNLSYRFNPKWVLRGSAMKTINRPEFRELSPFPFYDFTIPADKSGNPDLKVCDIWNFDSRLEYYPTEAEMIAIGVFYKHFKNPIEAYILQGSSNLVYQFNNAPEASSYGIEFEIRKSLETFTRNEFIERFSLLFNGSLIYSQIDFGNDLETYSNLIQKRPMQGQSPYVVNAGLYYSYRKTKLSALYNVYGPRIFSVGDNQTRTIYEMPRASLDVTYAYTLNEKTELRIGFSNLLNSAIRLQEDGNNNRRLNEKDIDKNVSYYKIGQNINVGFVYNF